MTEASGFDPAQDIRLDATTLRAIAHPLRVRMLGRLRMHGSATASQLARALNESSGATSYHLRQLEAHGFVAEDPERGTGRERWWKALHRTTYFDTGLSEENAAAGGEYLRAVARNYADRIVRYADSVEAKIATPDALHDSHTISDWTLHLTPEQGAALYRDVFDLMNRYRDLPRTPGAETLIAQIQLMPLSEDES